MPFKLQRYIKQLCAPTAENELVYSHDGERLLWVNCRRRSGNLVPKSSNNDVECAFVLSLQFSKDSTKTIAWRIQKAVVVSSSAKVMAYSFSNAHSPSMNLFLIFFCNQRVAVYLRVDEYSPLFCQRHEEHEITLLYYFIQMCRQWNWNTSFMQKLIQFNTITVPLLPGLLKDISASIVRKWDQRSKILDPFYLYWSISFWYKI